MAARGSCHAQRSEQIHLDDLLETSYFITGICCPLLASAWALGPSNVHHFSDQIIKSKNVSWERTQIVSLQLYKGWKKYQKEPTKCFKMSQPKTVAFHQYLSIVTYQPTDLHRSLKPIQTRQFIYWLLQLMEKGMFENVNCYFLLTY